MRGALVRCHRCLSHFQRHYSLSLCKSFQRHSSLPLCESFQQSISRVTSVISNVIPSVSFLCHFLSTPMHLALATSSFSTSGILNQPAHRIHSHQHTSSTHNLNAKQARCNGNRWFFGFWVSHASFTDVLTSRKGLDAHFALVVMGTQLAFRYSFIQSNFTCSHQ
jgi:hypothetical protein